jgi:hypothetical protein
MHKGRCFAVQPLVVLLAACGTIKPYTVIVPAPDSTLLPASAELARYTKKGGLTIQVERTTLYCGKVKQAIASELDHRSRRNSATKRILLLIGSAAALATTVYSGLKENPSKNVIVPLGAITGTALLTALPSLTEDERAGTLRDKLAAIKSKEGVVVDNLNAMEKGLLDLGLLQLQIGDSATSKAEVEQLKKDRLAMYSEIAPLEDHLRTSLSSLANECD